MNGPEELRALVEALKEAEETLRLVEHPAFPDPAHHDEVKRLGRRIGFGALMSTASAGWREVLEERGDPLGGEFVAGPCHSTVVYALRVIRTALTRAESSLASPAGMEGWQLAPKEPTPEMLGAWYRYKNGHRWPGEEPARDTSDVGAYRAMLSAASALWRASDMGITFGDHLIDSGYYDITPEQEREREEQQLAQTREEWAREECKRRCVDPDEIVADGGVQAWMVLVQGIMPVCPHDCYRPGDCDGSCTHPLPAAPRGESE